jgi:hypothetical protein
MPVARNETVTHEIPHLVAISKHHERDRDHHRHQDASESLQAYECKAWGHSPVPEKTRTGRNSNP